MKPFDLGSIPVKDMNKKERAAVALSLSLFLRRYEDHTCVYMGCGADEFSEEVYGGHVQGCPPRMAAELADQLQSEWEYEISHCLVCGAHEDEYCGCAGAG